MAQILRKSPGIAFLIPLLVFATCFLLTQWSLPEAVYIGITYDLIILSPALYFLAIRKTSIPNITVVPVMVAGTIVGSYLLPESARSHFDVLESTLIPLVELVVFGVAGVVSYRTIKQMRSSNDTSLDFFQIFEKSLNKVLGHPRLAKIMSLEFGGLYYALFVWKTNAPKKDEFSYHSESGLKAILYAVIGITILETGVLHVLLTRWNETVAWVLTILSIYGGLMILAQIKTVSRRPHRVHEEYLELKNGLFGYAKVHWNNIESMEVSEKDLPEEDKSCHKLAFLGALESHNAILHFNEPLVVEGAYGKKIICTHLYFHVDLPEKLQGEVTSRISAA